MSKSINPKVSVLVANYNNASYLNFCINSLINQTYSNLEIVVIDDNSTDNSNKILDKFRDKVLFARKNKLKLNIASYDQAKSYLECFKISSGEIIFFCDSDDYFDQHKIECIVNQFLKKEEIDIIFDDPILIYKNKLVKKNKRKKFYNSYWPYIVPTSCIAIKKKVYFNYLNYLDFENFPDLWLDFRISVISEYLLKKKTLFINKGLTYYRQHETNISSNFKFFSKNWWKRRRQAHKYIEFFFKNNQIKFNFNLDYRITKIINYFF